MSNSDPAPATMMRPLPQLAVWFCILSSCEIVWYSLPERTKNRLEFMKYFMLAVNEVLSSRTSVPHTLELAPNEEPPRAKPDAEYAVGGMETVPFRNSMVEPHQFVFAPLPPFPTGTR